MGLYSEYIIYGIPYKDLVTVTIISVGAIALYSAGP